ncbi:hypothetical protein FGO68_gene8888 [Halteria grandinella]|uniref:Uncharacterized protein n=1 Tax=Halteria grandinella TaxID=5974 RepID=A0A8J8T2E2_HALGN|nr:hypothetical protein FGO68_gene8888 [Halteria grandinella]
MVEQNLQKMLGSVCPRYEKELKRTSNYDSCGLQLLSMKTLAMLWIIQFSQQELTSLQRSLKSLIVSVRLGLAVPSRLSNCSIKFLQSFAIHSTFELISLKLWSISFHLACGLLNWASITTDL